MDTYVLFRLMLCCKTGSEFEQYYRSTEAGKRYRLVCAMCTCMNVAMIIIGIFCGVSMSKLRAF